MSDVTVTISVADVHIFLIYFQIIQGRAILLRREIGLTCGKAVFQKF